ncbi:MAG TPA: hypothetical protein VNA13_01625 [Xanthomonadales bacterium]|nr:hypothetical protein [Xanthomonadales bacterium]
MVKQLIPEYITQYFWGDNLEELDIEKNKKYIVETLLERGDQRAIKWVLQTSGAESIKSILPDIKLSKKSANFWNIYFS